MRRTVLEKVISSRLRLEISRRKRGTFRVTIPAALTADGIELVREFPNKKHACTFALVRLGMLPTHTVRIEHVRKAKS
jgi:hypothetical protein